MASIREKKVCVFCAEDNTKRKYMIPLFEQNVHSQGYICDKCLDKLNFIRDEMELVDQSNLSLKAKNTILTPKEIKAELDKYVIRQEKAKITLSVAVYNTKLNLQLFDYSKCKS